jgi:hypothetical protein
MNPFLENLKRQAEENPMVAIGIGGALVTMFTKFLGIVVDINNSRAWQKEVNRRRMNDLLKK